MEKKYVVVAGAAPMLHRTVKKSIGNTDVYMPQTLSMHDVIEENDYTTDEIISAVRGGFIEEYEPHVVSAEDAAANKHLKLKEGQEIHKKHKGFTPTPKAEEKQKADEKKK